MVEAQGPFPAFGNGKSSVVKNRQATDGWGYLAVKK
jgi:hypothetical protein